MNACKIEHNNELGFVLLQVLANFIEISFAMREKICLYLPKYTKHRNLFDSWTKSVVQEW